jgi:hypothetical protein
MQLRASWEDIDNVSMNRLVGREVIVTFTDPWDFVTDNGEQVTGRIAEARGEQELLIELDREVCSDRRTSRLLAARPRHKGVEIHALAIGAEIACNFTATAAGAGPFQPGESVTFAVTGSLRV